LQAARTKVAARALDFCRGARDDARLNPIPGATCAPSEAPAMIDTAILSFETGARIRRMRIELDGWRRRLRLAYERNWDRRAREICKKEIERLSILVRASLHDVD
jgi:hypothetical protein